ncbi:MULTISPECIES: restriction endonuclease subunit S [Escherichia]|uniref:restriction endonuclease subunit S n=1 Tax=Escherichia TaxID=561 RepID=UPI000BB0CD98|nr:MULTISPECIES: restriction endonuclease subunit S [Escherichia]EJA7514663.1 restriction endonuclease subunit S [Escherichia coli]MBY7471579.1 restriction endonuclease subunit S [Escherichia marmotae]MCQ1910277.1 restriction endonuclease subunit S [Escherichia coli]OZM87556.1 restriction endonuclease subunit S [Escherichia coli]CAD5815183.1 putative restriction-modification DNA specificity domain protein [Escherichia coli]
MVPKGWEKNSLDSLFEFKNGLNTEKEQYGNGYKFVNVMDVFRNDILTESKIIGRVQVTDKQLEGYQLKYGDVLFNRTSETFDEIAIAAIYLDNAIATFGGFVIRARPKGNQIDPAYSVFLFQSKSYRSQVVKLGQGAIRANIGQKDLARVCILVPPLAEQKKIAQILSTWDKAISVTEKLLANSQRQKKALMQQLITGNKRLLDENGVRFSREWKQVELGDVFEKVSNGLTYDANSLDGLPVTRIETISTGRVNFEKVGWAPDCDNTRRFKLNLGDILYSHINSLEHIGRVAYFNDDKPLYHGMNLLLLRTKMQNNSLFLFHLLNSQVGKKYAKTYAKSAVNQASISTTDIKTFKVFIPERLEQQKIASVLSAADAEISILEKKLACLKDEKKALMQQLLTGKRRVKVDEAVAV